MYFSSQQQLSPLTPLFSTRFMIQVSLISSEIMKHSHIFLAIPPFPPFSVSSPLFSSLSLSLSLFQLKQIHSLLVTVIMYYAVPLFAGHLCPSNHPTDSPIARCIDVRIPLLSLLQFFFLRTMLSCSPPLPRSQGFFPKFRPPSSLCF